MKVSSQVVQPGVQRWESPLLAGATALLVLVTGLYAVWFGREEPGQRLEDWQISAYSDLDGADQAIYNQLQVAAEEIVLMHLFNGVWPDWEDFQEVYLPPFYRDLGWEQNGAIEWRLVVANDDENGNGLTLYHGGEGEIPGQGAWMVRIDHSHAGGEQISEPTIWWHPEADAPPPPQTGVSAFILEGWRQVVPYQGRDEVERINAG